MCRGVSHTPSCGRKRNDNGEHIIIVFKQTCVGAYRIRPDVGEYDTNPQPNKTKNSTEQV